MQEGMSAGTPRGKPPVKPSRCEFAFPMWVRLSLCVDESKSYNDNCHFTKVNLAPTEKPRFGCFSHLGCRWPRFGWLAGGRREGSPFTLFAGTNLTKIFWNGVLTTFPLGFILWKFLHCWEILFPSIQGRCRACSARRVEQAGWFGWLEHRAQSGLTHSYQSRS